MNEVQALRERVAQLERELAAQSARTNQLIAQAQERTYWLDRLGLDLDRVMAKPAVWRAYRLAGRTRHLLRTLKGRLK